MIIRSRSKKESPVDYEVRFKLLAKQIIDKLEKGRVREVGEDYNKLLVIYKKLIKGAGSRELYPIMNNVYEKYYTQVVKIRKEFRD